ncbi:CatB-related O-acetyltransferase [Aquimarina brevivitae]|uniref:Succinyltransferase-like protein n=1 Tax=Aquimarina brevivitae TaxID=323412 RepID=A0A4Q7PFN9_9FLAO|nr:succinyltransferase-like protein [Aquimarina brevivitae]
MINILRYILAKTLKKIKGSAIRNSKIDSTSKVEAGSNIVNTIMGKHSFCGYNCEITSAEIGSFCSIANGVIIGGGMHPYHWVSMSPVFYKGRDSVKAKFSEHNREPVKKTVIGHDVWIGQNALIKQGVNIGTGAVIGMGSVVTKDVPPYTIMGGVPARQIKKRFPEKMIVDLLNSKWWELNDRNLTNFASHFKNPDEFIKRFSKDLNKEKQL